MEDKDKNVIDLVVRTRGLRSGTCVKCGLHITSDAWSNGWQHWVETKETELSTSVRFTPICD